MIDMMKQMIRPSMDMAWMVHGTQSQTIKILQLSNHKSLHPIPLAVWFGLAHLSPNLPKYTVC